MNGYDFVNGWFQDVPKLIAETDLLYATKIVPAGLPDKLSLTRSKIIELRKWQPALPLIEKNFDRVLTELNVFYVPKVLEPGPCVVFPQRDVFGNWRRARIKPIGDWLVLKGEPARYAGIGLKQEFIGPAWIGNSRLMVERILKHRWVLLVEGVFDILAIMLLCPDIPVLSTGTDGLGWKHLDYLRILGVKQAVIMFDQDEKNSKGVAPGIEAMRNLQRKLERNRESDMKATSLTCNVKDPSKALESYMTVVEFKRRLSSLL